MDSKLPPKTTYTAYIQPTESERRVLIYANLKAIGEDRFEYDPVGDKIITYLSPSAAERTKFPALGNVEELWVITDAKTL